jgi:hypothetical protein
MSVYDAFMEPTDSEQVKRLKLELQFTREAAAKKIAELEQENKLLQKEALYFLKLAKFWEEVIELDGHSAIPPGPESL